jgi:hypothetical protein
LSELTYTLLTDGSSDDAVRPIVEWLLRVNGVSCAIQGVWADLRPLRRPPDGLRARVERAVELFSCELLFVHRDAETFPYGARHSEIARAVGDAAFAPGPQPAWVCVIPVRMTEAWLLCDEGAIRRAAGNPSGTMALNLPPPGQLEGLPDPKSILSDLLRQASGLGSRRRATLRIGQLRRRIADYTADFRPLRELPAFAALERDVRVAIQENRWHRR